jgi:hypothetical protein
MHACTYVFKPKVVARADRSSRKLANLFSSLGLHTYTYIHTYIHVSTSESLLKEAGKLLFQLGPLLGRNDPVLVEGLLNIFISFIQVCIHVRVRMYAYVFMHAFI